MQPCTSRTGAPTPVVSLLGCHGLLGGPKRIALPEERAAPDATGSTPLELVRRRARGGVAVYFGDRAPPRALPAEKAPGVLGPPGHLVAGARLEDHDFHPAPCELR